MSDAKLWEPVHPYHCNGSGEGEEFDSWAEFVADYDGADDDLNLVVRWDWLDPDGWKHGDKDSQPLHVDVYYRDRRLHVFFLQQRKARVHEVTVDVCQADEPAVRAWLTKKWVFLSKLWAPVAALPLDQKTEKE